MDRIFDITVITDTQIERDKVIRILEKALKNCEISISGIDIKESKE